MKTYTKTYRLVYTGNLVPLDCEFDANSDGAAIAVALDDRYWENTGMALYELIPGEVGTPIQKRLVRVWE